MDIICEYENEEWGAVISDLYVTNGWIRFNVKARGSSIDVVTGKADEIYWIIFPYLVNGCVITRFDDIY